MPNFNITELDIFQSFFGEIGSHSDKYKMNIQNEKRGKVLKLPFKIKPRNEKIIVRMKAQRLVCRRPLPLLYKGESE